MSTIQERANEYTKKFIINDGRTYLKSYSRTLPEALKRAHQSALFIDPWVSNKFHKMLIDISETTELHDDSRFEIVDRLVDIESPDLVSWILTPTFRDYADDANLRMPQEDEYITEMIQRGQHQFLCDMYDIILDLLEE